MKFKSMNFDKIIFEEIILIIFVNFGALHLLVTLHVKIVFNTFSFEQSTIYCFII